ncbi:hypothetical protein BDV97DRAFT_355002 [Delphinella strobiligena]|nr:hypothetical protein BDV97DRAFT_355002 [Delphinella strobiligena]
MPLRDKLRKVFHRDSDDESHDGSQASQSSPNSPVQSSTRYVNTNRSDASRIGQRPLSVAGNGSPVSNARSKDTSTTGRGNPASPSIDRLSNADRQTALPGTARRSEDVMSSSRAPANVRPNRYSEDVADWNIDQSNKSRVESSAPQLPPLRMNREPVEMPGQSSMDRDVQRGSETPSALSSGRPRGESISRKAIVQPSSTLMDETTHNLAVKHSSPDLKGRVNTERSPPASSTIKTPRDMAVSDHVKNYAVKDAAEAPSLAGIVDLQNTVDTTVNEKWAGAVTHNTVNREIHHIREEQITREIHYHHVYHRILPIIDIEVLPTRHFVPDGKGGLTEISEHEIPGQTGPYRPKWVIAETVSSGEVEPRRFTARQFHGTEGDYKEYISPEGIPTTETTWVHPPVLEEYSELTGQTVPFYFGCEDPRDNGLRVYAPTGPVSGCSRAFAEEHQVLEAPVEDMGKLSLNGAASTSSPRTKKFATSAALSTPPQTATRAGF